MSWYNPGNWGSSLFRYILLGVLLLAGLIGAGVMAVILWLIQR